jgi:hypothetical protein
VNEVNPPADIIPPRKPWADWLLILVFAALLWLPILDYFSGVDCTDPAGENRLPAPKPRLAQLNLAGVQNYLSASEMYFNDHFGFRKRLIRWFQQWKGRLYHDQSVNKVVLGQNGWLFTGEEQMVDHYLGMAKFTPEQLKSWQTLLEKRRDWLAARGIKYLFIIPPDKPAVYPEFLPSWLQNAAPANRETKLDQFLKYMKAHSTVEVLDLRPSLLAAKTTAPTYLQNDTHWNLFGSFVACQEVIKTLTKQFPDLPPLRLEDFTWTNTPATGGDLARMLGLDAAENNFISFQSNPALPVLCLDENRAFKSDWGIRRVLTVENPAARQRKVVLFHDSYGGTWPKFLGQSFRRAVFEWESHEFNPTLISANAPDVVINEILERYFYIMDPQEMLVKDALP